MKSNAQPRPADVVNIPPADPANAALVEPLNQIKGISDNHRAALVFLAERGGTVAATGAEIAFYLGLSGGYAWRVMTNLEETGLVRVSRRVQVGRGKLRNEYQLVWAAIAARIAAEAKP